MTKRYDWSKLPEGVTYMHGGRPHLVFNHYEYMPDRGALLTPLNSDPDAAAEAYAKLRAAAKACEVTWRSEWQEATGMFLPDSCDGATFSDSGIRISGHDGRKHRVTIYGPTAAPASAVKRIAQIAEKLEALGWKAG